VEQSREEAAPLVVGDTMYIVSAYPNVLYALDLAKPGAPLKWNYEPKPQAAAQGVAWLRRCELGRRLLRPKNLLQRSTGRLSRSMLKAARRSLAGVRRCCGYKAFDGTRVPEIVV
jgi:hypothetical protein